MQIEEFAFPLSAVVSYALLQEFLRSLVWTPKGVSQFPPKVTFLCVEPVLMYVFLCRAFGLLQCCFHVILLSLWFAGRVGLFVPEEYLAETEL